MYLIERTFTKIKSFRKRLVRSHITKFHQHSFPTFPEYTFVKRETKRAGYRFPTVTLFIYLALFATKNPTLYTAVAG